MATADAMVQGVRDGLDRLIELGNAKIEDREKSIPVPKSFEQAQVLSASLGDAVHAHLGVSSATS